MERLTGGWGESGARKWPGAEHMSMAREETD